MSDEEGCVKMEPAESLLTTEFRDGQLQIVEVAPYKQGRSTETQILPDLDGGETPEHRYVQVLNADKSVVQLDLLNMTLVRCEDGPDTIYKLVANSEASSTDTPSDSVCVLQASDQEDQDNQDSYVVMDGQEAPLVFLPSEIMGSNTQTTKHDTKPKKLCASEILEKAKALKQAAEMVLSSAPRRRAGRKRKSQFPPPHELLASPNFKLFLYSCKMCDFKCNAIKEMTAHKTEQHSSGARARAGRAGAPLQCARCPYKATSHAQLMRHVQERHLARSDNDIISLSSLDSKDVEEAHVLVCGACGFECSTKVDFKIHIRDRHGASAASICDSVE